MKHFKRMMSVFLAGMLFFSSTACSANQETSSQKQGESGLTDSAEAISISGYLASDTYYAATEYGALTNLWGAFSSKGVFYTFSDVNGGFSLIQVDNANCYELYEAPEGSYLLWLAGNDSTLAFVQSTVQENSEQLVLYTVGIDGTNLKEVSVDLDLLESAGGMAMDSFGNLYLPSASSVQVLDIDGQELFSVTPAGQMSDLASGLNGSVYVSSYLEDCTYVEQIDPATKETTDSYVFDGQWQLLRGFDTWDFLLNDEDQLLGYDGQALTEIINWSTNSIRSSALAAVWKNTQDALCYFDQNRLYQLSEVDKTDIPDASNLTLGVWDGTNLESVITFYQKQHPEVTIDIHQYSLSDGMTELYLELAAGDCPDMLDLAWVNYAAYVSKGILEDLTPFLSAEGLSLDDFIGTEVLKTDGSLYVLPTSFAIDTWKGLSGTFGNDIGWTWDDYQNMQSELNDGQHMTAVSPEDFLLSNLSELIQECVDPAAATCDFAQLQEVLVAAKDCDFSGEFFSSDLDEGTVKMEGAYISSVEEYDSIVKGGHYTLIGMPSEDGRCTASFTFLCLLGITSSSNNMDGAWDLIHYAVCEYPYEDMVSLYGLSNYRRVVETEIEQLLAPASKYGDVEITGSEDEGYTIDGVYYEPGIITMTPAITQDVVTSFWEYIDSISLYYAYDSAISNIILEESAAYFNGDKSAGDVIDIIENRVSIFLWEQQ